MQQNFKQLGRLEWLPVVGVIILTATGKKSQRISKVIILNTNTGNINYNMQCLVVPELLREIIIGADSISELGMDINFDMENININYDNNIY